MTESPQRKDEPEISRRIAEFVESRRFEHLDEAAVAVAKQCLLDTIGVAIAGRREEPVKIVIALSPPEGEGPASIIGGPGGMQVDRAAFVNGVMAHALDFDDVHPAMYGHPTAVIAPAVLALAEAEESSGRDLLLAFATGVDVACLLGRYVGPDHYEAGFHATSTLGVFGAAAACSKLLGLSRSAIVAALGLAASQAAGLKAAFGTMAKPLVVGRAAQCGVSAAQMARAGFSGPTRGIEGAQGFAATHTTRASPEAFRAAFVDVPFVRSVVFKYHASCGLTHAMLDAIDRLKTGRRLDPDDVDEAIVQVSQTHARVCSLDGPADGTEIKFSLKFLCAMALSGWDTSDVGVYTSATAADPGLRALATKVKTCFDQPSTEVAHVSVSLRSGATLRAQHSSASRPLDLARQQTALEEKFRKLTAGHLSAGAVDELLQHIGTLEKLGDVGSLMRRLCARPSGSGVRPSLPVL